LPSLVKKPFVRLIDGHDLIRQLKLKPSPLFGKILNAVEEAQTLGNVKTKEEALELARSVAEKIGSSLPADRSLNDRQAGVKELETFSVCVKKSEALCLFT